MGKILKGPVYNNPCHEFLILVNVERLVSTKNYTLEIKMDISHWAVVLP